VRARTRIAFVASSRRRVVASSRRRVVASSRPAVIVKRRILEWGQSSHGVRHRCQGLRAHAWDNAREPDHEVAACSD
jgi:hypothetical protein